MTAQDLTALADKLDELAMKATPGPWLPPEVIPPMGREAGWVLLRFNGEGYAWTDMPKQLTFNSEPRSRDEYLQDVADAELLIALRNALPQITTALREAARMREALEKIQTVADNERMDATDTHYAVMMAGIQATARAALESPHG